MNLRLENIRHNYASTSFSFNGSIQNGMTGVFGYSGAGKTTLLNILCGIVVPKSGRISFNDKVFFDQKKKINLPVNKRNIGVVFQDNFLFPHLNIKRNLLYSDKYNKNKPMVVKYRDVIELLDLDNLLDKRPMELSGGERQRVSIGRALLSQPELLLLDEPFSNLDRKRRMQIISYLLMINEAFNIPMLIISHDLEDMLKLTQSLLVVKNGEIMASGKYLEIADSGLVPDIIEHKRFINIPEVYHSSIQVRESLNLFSFNEKLQDPMLKTNTQCFSSSLKGKKVRLGIYPDDIALTDRPVPSISIQNQMKGRVTKIRTINNSFFVTLDCGMELVAEVTRSAVDQMNICPGKTVYCLIKAKAIEVVHVFQ